LSAGDKAITILKDSLENNPITNLPSESPMGDVDG